MQVSDCPLYEVNKHGICTWNVVSLSKAKTVVFILFCIMLVAMVTCAYRPKIYSALWPFYFIA
jgi:hypothetical protein